MKRKKQLTTDEWRKESAEKQKRFLQKGFPLSEANLSVLANLRARINTPKKQKAVNV